MAWVSLCRNASIEEAADVIIAEMKDLDRQRAEWLASQSSGNQEAVAASVDRRSSDSEGN